MDDIISRKAAVDLIRDTASGYTVSMFATSDECFAARLVATNLAVEINSMPSIEAEPVRHGKWYILVDDFDCEYMQCSECENDVYPVDGCVVDTKYSYCPHCGAKMDLEG